jgi:hypothetical protein
MKPVTVLALLACLALASPDALAGTLYWSCGVLPIVNTKKQLE